jgi:hypothetical protein
MVRVLNGASFVAGSGHRMRTKMLLNPGSTSSRDYRAAVRDASGNWSEYASVKSLACPNFAAGVSDRSIASGAANDTEIEEPGVLLPDWTQGSGRGAEYQTLTSDGAFVDESRRAKWPVSRTHFSVIFSELDQEDNRLLHRLYRAANGAQKPVEICYADPMTGESLRFFCRFTDAKLGSSFDTFDRHSARLSLAAIPMEGEGSTT